jgi:hypothetical protein
MSTSTALSLAATKAVIDTAWRAMLRICEGAFSREIHDIVEMEEEQEKHQRARRDRFPVSVNYAARMFTLQHILEAPSGSVEWSEIGRYAPRVLAAYSLGARLRVEKLPTHRQGMKPVFVGETYMIRLVPTITQALAEKLSDKDYSLLHARRSEMGVPDHLPVVCCLDYSADIVRGK